MSGRLDPERLARAFYTISRRRPVLGALLPEWDALPNDLRDGSIRDGAELADEYARLTEDDSPLGHGTPVPEEATLPSGDARVAGL